MRCYGRVWAVRGLPLAPRLFSFPFFLYNTLSFPFYFPAGKLRGNRQILGSEPSLRLVWLWGGRLGLNLVRCEVFMYCIFSAL